MRISRKAGLAFVLIGIAAVVCVVLFARHQVEPLPPYVDATLAVRGFRHEVLDVAPGETREYDVDVGEQFKVAWATAHLSEDGQLLYRGPKGVGSGLIAIPLSEIATGSRPFLQFTAKESGDAVFVLTATGPGQDGIYTLTNTLTVHITAPVHRQ